MICFDCGAEYRAVYTGGRLQNLNKADNKPHWQTCSAKVGRKFRQSVVAKRIRADKPVTQRALRKRYGESQVKVGRQSCGQCPLPPWESCACSFTADELASHRANMEAANRLAILQPELDLA